MIRHIYVGIIVSLAKLMYSTTDKTDGDNVSHSVKNIKKLQLWFK